MLLMVNLQVCSNGTRVYVHESIWSNFVDKLVEKTCTLKVGDPMEEATRVGATIHEQHFHKVASYIEEAKKQVNLSFLFQKYLLINIVEDFCLFNIINLTFILLVNWKILSIKYHWWSILFNLSV